MIRKITTLAFCAMMLTFNNAQTFDVGGLKSSHTKENLLSIKSVEVMPEFDLDAVLAANAINEANKVGPYMFGYEHQVNMDLNNAGQWDYLNNGDRVWRLRIKSQDALSLNFSFTDFFLPEGAHLHIYNIDKTSILGAYTSQNNNVNNQLGTELIKGSEGVIEYYEPKEVAGQGRLLLTMIVHGYKDINGWYSEKGLNDSDPCNLDVICPAGDDWRDEIRSVARIVNGGGVCTGTLLNNTSLDGTPYFLTANHCSPQNMGTYSFQFQYESPTCGSQTASNSTAPTGSLNVVSGSTLRARKADSDFGLLELNAIPVNPYYSGWDNSGAIPQTAVGIHHPSGDVKKISFDDDLLQSAAGLSIANSSWRIEAWERNTTTEPGSSGSGLWDQNHRIIGQLHGGSATCANSVDDYYGKFSMSWDGNGATTSAQRLHDWLDPQNTGATTLDGYDPNAVSVDYDAALQNTAAIETLCSSQFTPEVTIKNSGLTTLTSATITYNLNGGTNQVYNWTGSLATNASETITLPSMTISGTGSNTFSATVSNPNGQSDENNMNDVISSTFSAVPNSMTMYLNLTVDCYGEEVAWEVREQGSGTALFSGSNYPGTGAAPIANGTQITEEFCLSNGCYTFEITDTYGDGMAGAQYPGCDTDGDYNLQDYYGNTFFTMGTDPDYGNGTSHDFCISTVGVEESVLESTIGLFPNPTESIFTITNNGDTQIEEITVLNALGAIVLIENNIVSERHDVNISTLENGVYFVRINTNNGSVTRKVVKQ